MTESIYAFVLEQLQLAKGNWPAVSKCSGVPLRTVEKVARREVKNPGVITIEKLAAHFQGRPRQPIRRRRAA